VCLDVKGARVVKGVQFEGLRDVGDPVSLSERYEREGADEITFLDISASAEERATLLDVARRTAERLFIPLTIGGGVRTADDVARALRAGADKVSLNSAAVARPGVLTEAAHRFGAQCVVASIDAKLSADGTWRVWVKGGREETPLEAIAWAQECVARGAGEILLTSINQDGARTGYDLPLTRAVADAVPVPVIASGGAGRASHLIDAVQDGHADAVLVAGILHDGVTTVRELKASLRAAGIPVRDADALSTAAA
jgi:cyclase